MEVVILVRFEFSNGCLILSIISRFKFGNGHLISEGFKISSGRLILSIILRFKFNSGCLISARFKNRRWLSNPTFSKLLMFQICNVIMFSISQNSRLSCIVFHIYLVSIDFQVFSQHPTYASSIMLLKHVNRYIFQHHHGITDKNKK